MLNCFCDFLHKLLSIINCVNLWIRTFLAQNIHCHQFCVWLLSSLLSRPLYSCLKMPFDRALRFRINFNIFSSLFKLLSRTKLLCGLIYLYRFAIYLIHDACISRTFSFVFAIFLDCVSKFKYIPIPKKHSNLYVTIAYDSFILAHKMVTSLNGQSLLSVSTFPILLITPIPLKIRPKIVWLPSKCWHGARVMKNWLKTETHRIS